jgi:prephenate dehydratase
MTQSGRPRVAFQGEPGAFSEEAVERFFADATPVPVPTWRSIFDTVSGGDAAAGVAAIENSLAGTIRETYDLLFEFSDAGIGIVGEVSVPVRLSLLALPGETLADIRRVYSHAQALAQADDFLRTREWSVMTTYNTAGAARVIAERRERGAAAVASPRVAELYGLDVLARDIQTGADNHTRFAVLCRGGLEPAWIRRPDGPGSRMKTTFVFAVRNVPGSLHRSLGAFAERGLNLSKLESRPSRSARWEYVFWVDLDADAADPRATEAFDELRRESQLVRILGSYSAADETQADEPHAEPAQVEEAAAAPGDG